MENGYGLYSQGSSGWTSMRNEEFQEGDVWEVLNKIEDPHLSVEESTLIAKRLLTTPKTIPKSITKSSTPQKPKISRQSAPVNVPDWSKLYGTSSKKSSSSWLDADSDDTGNNHDSESDDECQAADEIPPHEWIARRIARGQISSFSVCEGAGRTLKGRDLSRMRNAVLTKTGFLEKSDY